MVDPVSISEAAGALNLSSARVRAMVAQGRMPATRIGNGWFIERSAVEQRRRDGSPSGRRLSPRNSWALLVIASGEDVEKVDPSVRSRLKRAVMREGLEALKPRLRGRAKPLSFRAHPGEISHLLKDPEFVRSGVSAAKEFGLVPGQEASGYLEEESLKSFVARHALEPAGSDGNVQLGVVPREAWRFLGGRRVAPRAAIALDLAEEADPRASKSGREALRAIDRQHHHDRSAD